MASQKILKSQNALRVRPSPFRELKASQQPQKELDEDELNKEDLEYLHVLENYFLNIKEETRERKKKESKKRKISKLASGEPLGSPKLEIGNVSPLIDSSVKSSSSKKKRLEFLNDFPSQKDGRSNKMCKIPDTSSIKVEKKKKTHKVHFDSSGSPILCNGTENVNLISGSSFKSSSSKKKKNKRFALEILENFLPEENGQSDKISDSSSVKVKKAKKKNQEVHSESPLPNNCFPLGKQRTPEKRSSRKKMRRRQEAESLKSSLSSPDNLPKAFLEDKTGVTGKADDANTVPDHSQDLFITQKQFLPTGLFICSEDSPPLGQEQQGAASAEQSGSEGSSCGIRPLSRSLSKSEDDSCEMKDFGAMAKDKSTQTDNLFTYLSLMTFLKRVTGLEACSEKPLDLSLKCRTRAVSSRGGLVNDDEVIIIGSSPDATALEKNRERQIILSPPQPFDNSKFVQTILNSSYYFRGKGKKSELSPITPLLKLKKEPKKKRRRSIRS